jgi:hypothetical protein
VRAAEDVTVTTGAARCSISKLAATGPQYKYDMVTSFSSAQQDADCLSVLPDPGNWGVILPTGIAKASSKSTSELFFLRPTQL